MRMLFIICESGVEERVMDMLVRVHAPGYTRFTGAIGNGKHGRREGTPIWPGMNSLIMTCVPEELLPDIRQGIEHLRNEREGRLAVRLYAVPADEIC